MRPARSTGAVGGMPIALLGVWGALIPFIGPYFDYSFGVNATWHYTSDRLWLSILPGAAAFIAGLVIAAGPLLSLRKLAARLALIAGVWFVVGPPLSMLWERHAGPIGAPLFSATRQGLELLGCFYGLGAVIVALAAYLTGQLALAPPQAVPQLTPQTAARQRRRLGRTRHPHAA
jgi:hypothetical protein